MTTLEYPRSYVTPQEVADRLGVSIATVRRHIARGSFPAYRLGAKGTAIRLDWNEVQDWLRGDPEAA